MKNVELGPQSRQLLTVAAIDDRGSGVNASGYNPS